MPNSTHPLPQVRNLKRDIETIDPVDEVSFGVAGAFAALFARNPALITKQARATAAPRASELFDRFFSCSSLLSTSKS